jgi:peptidoglycan/xylan/chitin deacetylase (PgdA/CDA1 family)
MTAHPVIRASLALLVVALVLQGCSQGPNETPPPSPSPSAAASGGPSAARPGSGSPGSPGASGVGSGAPSGSSAGSSDAAASPSPSFVVYTVVRGDSLLSIARRYKTSGRSIAYWNRDTYPSLDPDSKKYQPNRIEIGWKLRLIPNVILDEQGGALPSRKPTPIPIPSGSRPPPPSLPADGSALMLSNGSRDSNQVALTFDLGNELTPTVDVVTWLVDNDVPATMFVEGQTVSTTDAGRKALELIAAHPDLFTVGNYSWDGTAFTQLTTDQIAEQLTLAENAIATATGRSTKPFFRPPLGAQDARVRSTGGSLGWVYMIMWDVDTLDAKAPSEGGPTAADIVAKVLSRAQPGSIIRMHVGGYNTLEALPGIVDGLRARGLDPVSLNTLFGF